MTERLTELTCRYLDRVITPAEFAELDALIARDPQAAALVRTLTVQSRILTEPLRDRVVALAPQDPPKPDRSETKVRMNSAIPDFQFSIFNSRIVFLAAALLLAAAALVIYALAFSNPRSATEGHRSPIGDPNSAPPIATLIDSTGTVTYEDEVASSGSEYSSGAYSIDSGRAQFILRSQVVVDLSGRSRLRMHDASRVSLIEGSAAFVCPPGAEGFTVDLPNGARVVDLGTAFRLAVDEHGQTSLWVTDGAVRITHPGEEGVVLTAGYGLHTRADGLAYGTVERPASAAPGFSVRPLLLPEDIAIDGALIEANNIGAELGGALPPEVMVNGIAFGNDQSALGGPTDFAGRFVASDLADPDLNTLLNSIAGRNQTPQSITLRLGDLEPGRTYRLQVFVMLGRDDRTFVFTANDESIAVDIPADVTRGQIVSLIFTAESENLDLTVAGRPNAAGDYAPFINAYALHEMTP